MCFRKGDATMADAQVLADRLSQYMRSKGLKSTRQRDAIFEAFSSADVHLSLDEILALAQERHPGLGYATVYRTMKLLVEAGVAEERQFGDGQARFEAADGGEDHHDHLICRTCGHIFEFEDHEIEARQALIAKQRGLRIVAHRLDLWGECLSASTCDYRAARGK
jgi:Fur family transcriptional regulator, ferric uptake regulator